MWKRKIRQIILTCLLLVLTGTSMIFSEAVSAATETTSASGKEKVVILETSEGIVKKKASSSGTVVLPPDKNGKGYTFLGWSTRRGKTRDPKYQAYETIKVTGTIHLYPVKYKWKNEADLSVGKLADQLTAYSRIIFVGDSRTVMLKNTLEKQYGSSVYEKLGFVCRGGQGLTWLKQEGTQRLMNELKTNTSDSSKPVAVVFNLGVNDLIHRNGKSIDCSGITSDYASYMNRLSKKLKAQNCKVFYMSVNPANTAMKPTRKESEIRKFNSQLKKKLNSSFGWIDSYSYLLRYGYSTYRESSGGADDGLHYSMKTYKRIYAYVMKNLKKM